MKLLFNLFIVYLLSIYSCTEILSPKKKESKAPAILAALSLGSQNSLCFGSSSLSSIGTTNRTKFSIIKEGCSVSLGGGFTGDKVTTTAGYLLPMEDSSEGKLASTGSFSVNGEKKVNIELKYLITSSDGYIEVIGNGSASGASINGPGFKITTSGISVFNNTKISTAAMSGSPSTTVSQEKTLCLEIHEENGAHFFGWSKSCSELSSADRSSYEFEVDAFSTSNPGTNIGFTLKKAKIKEIIISSGAIGTKGRLL